MKIQFQIHLAFYILLSFPIYGQDDALRAFVGEEVLVAGDYTPVGIFASRNNLLSDVGVAYFELLSEGGQAVVQEMVYLDQGSGQAVLRIPEGLESSFYLFRVYTSDSDFVNISSIHHSWVAVINPDNPPVSADSLLVDSSDAVPSALQKSEKKQEVKFDLNTHEGIRLVRVKPYIPDLVIPSEVEFEKFVPNPSRFRKERELEGPILQVNGLQPKEPVFLSSMGKVNDLYFGEANEEGAAKIFMDREKKFQRLVLQTNQAEGIEIVNPFWGFIPKVKNWPTLQITEKTMGLLAQKALQKEVKKHFYLPDTIETSRVKKIADAYAIYNLDDYNRFETLALTFREYVPEVLVRNKRGKKELRMRTPGKITKENPLVILDGVPIFDIDAISNFNPRNIRRIEVSNRFYQLGGLQLHGIINLYSFNNDLGGFPMSYEAIILDYPNPQPLLKWGFPEHGEKSRKPDFRTMLHWDLRMKDDFGKPVSFYTSETEGVFMAEFYISDKAGEWFREVKYFEVK